MKRVLVIAILAAQSLSAAYAYKATLTIDHTQCGASDSSNFPVLVYISDTRLRTTGNGGAIQHTGTQTGGNAVTMPFDLVFTSDSAGSNPVPFEIDSYDGTGGGLWAWAKIGTVSHTVNTVFYAWFGSTSVSSQQNTGSFSVANVWDSNFEAVYHLADGSTLRLSDSTVNANTATNSGATAASGIVDGAASSMAANSFISLPSGVALGASYTMSAWVKPASFTGGYQGVMRYDGNANTSAIYIHASKPIWYFAGDLITGSTMTAGNWYHLALANSGGSVQLYVNGASIGSATQGQALGAFSDLHLAGDSFTQPLSGVADEARVSSVARSADWILTEYNNQSNPASFVAAVIAANATITGSQVIVF